MKFEKSTRAGKRFQVTFSNGKVVHFGSAGGRTFIDHGDKALRSAYLARHGKANENWNDPYSPGAISRWILWGDSPSFDVNHISFMKRFGVN